MEVLLILAVVLGVALGVGLTTWCLSRRNTGNFVWVVDAATDLSELEKSLNHFSEEGFGTLDRIVEDVLTHYEASYQFKVFSRRS
jgi:hypothetical protein